MSKPETTRAAVLAAVLLLAGMPIGAETVPAVNCAEVAEVIQFAASQAQTGDPNTVNTIYYSPAAQLRMAADEMDQKDRLIALSRKINEAIKTMPLVCVPRTKP